MSKTRKHMLLAFPVMIFLLGLGIAGALHFRGKAEKPYPEETAVIETEIQDIHFSDTDNKVSLTVSKDGGSDRIRLQEDTVIKDVAGNEVDVSDLKTGQTIRAKVHTDVLYDCISVEAGSEISNPSVNIFVRCYEVTILE